MSYRLPSIHRFSLLILFLVTFLGPACAAPVASIIAARGPVALQAGTGLRAIGLRSNLSIGDVVVTGPSGRATLLFLDGSQVRMNANTQVQITNPTGTGRGHKSIIRAISGELWARLRPGGAASTPTAIAGVRGTAFDIRIDPDGTSTLVVVEGEVDFYNELGAVQVAPNQSSTARPGAAPTRPVTVENPGLIVEWTLDLERAALPRELFYITANPTQAKNQAQNETDPSRKAQLLFDALDYQGALAAFTTLNNQEGMGRSQMELGRLDEANATLRTALAAPNNAVDPKIALAWLELEQARPAEAETLAGQATGDAGTLVLAVAQLRQGTKLEAAEANLNKIPQESNLKPQALAWLAVLNASQGDFEQAAKFGSEAAKLAPDSALAHGNYALALFYAGDFRLAAREAKAASAINPDSVPARVGLSQALLARGDVDAAAREAAIAVALDPQLPAARYLLGVAQAAKRNYGHGRRELETALKLAPDYLAAATALARLENAAGNETRAIAVLTDYQTREGTSAATLSALGITLFEQGEYKRAIESLEASVRLNPSSAQAQIDLAKAYLFSNRLRDSLETGQKAVELAPGVAQYHAVLGAIASYNAVTGLAERELRTALVLDPANALARLLLSVNVRDGRVGINTISQSLLTDPSVLRYLAPGGINTEINVAYTKNTERSLPVFQHLEEGKDRRYTVFTSVLHNRIDGGDTPNNFIKSTTATAYGVADIDSKTRILGSATRVDEKEGLPGLDYSPLGPEDADKHVSGTLFQLAARKRQGRGLVWGSLIYEPLRNVYRDPDNIAFPFANLFPNLPFITYGRQSFTSHSFVPEIRGDWLLNADSEAPLRVAAGYARQHGGIDVVQTVTNAIPNVYLAQELRSHVGYVQLAQRPTDRLSYIFLLRGESVNNSFRRTFDGNVDQAATREFFWLPGAVINYQLDKHSNLRFFADRTREDVTTVALAPVETRLTTEPSAGLLGSFSTERLFELDYERYLGGGNIVKAFVFSSAAKDVRLGGISELPVSVAPTINVPRAERTGAGVRLERRLSRNLIGSTTFTVNSTRATAPGERFDGEQAPYHPKYEAVATLDYISPGGNKARLRMRHAGNYFQDSGVPGVPATGRPTFRSQPVVDLLLAKEPSIHTEYYLNFYNLFNTRQYMFNGVRGGEQVGSPGYIVRGRGVEIGVAYRF